ncbi:putative protein T-ENOL [Pan paniscus]|uniref:putative protein T-ENOL n=1 Tax=Pan paniscus TaxID=9597 RepID=UPI00156120CB|nr:putative protein T-ENOL isoform X2 [Pan paniscus]
MASTLMGNEGEKKSSWPSQAAPSLRGGPASLSRSEEYLSRISTELMEEALCTACCHLNPVPIKKKQSQDQATQISKREHASKLLFCHSLTTSVCGDLLVMSSIIPKPSKCSGFITGPSSLSQQGYHQE